MKRTISILALFVMAVMLSSSAYNENSSWLGITGLSDQSGSYDLDSKDFKKEFSTKPGLKLDLDLEIGCDIEVIGWDKDVVDVDAEITGRDADDVEVDFIEDSRGITVRAEYDHRRRNRSTDGLFKVMVPYNYDVEFVTMGGSVKLQNINGEMQGKTMGGSIDLRKLKGEIDVTTMGGRIELVDSEVNGNVSTMGGEVLVEDVIGEVNAKSMGGNVIQRNVKRPSGNSVGSELNISTMGGQLKIDEAMNGAKLKTMGGDIEVNKAAKFVDAETMGGDVEIKEVNGWVEATTMGGDVYVKLTCDANDDDRDVKIKSMGGDITLYVPDNFSMDVEVEIVYCEDDEEDIEIRSDFDLTGDREYHKKDWNNCRTKKLIGEGNFNGGKNKVRILTYDGIVNIKKI